MTDVSDITRASFARPISRDGEPGKHVCLACTGRLAPSALEGLERCTSCGFFTANVELDATELARLYGRDYFHGSEYQDYVQERESLRLNFNGRLRTLDALIGGLRGKSLLEVGCAYGFFLELAVERGIRARGIDITRDGVDYARNALGVSAECGDYLALQTLPLDVIAMWDTVEHLPRPELFIAKAAADLKPGGVLAITTGDVGSLNARMRGSRWRMIHPPTHLHYFSVPTLSRLLQRNGLEVIHVSHPGISRRLHAILYMVLDQRLGAHRLYRVATRVAPNIAVTLNLLDIMFIVARKPAAGSARGT